jgi:hypothetical protein
MMEIEMGFIGLLGGVGRFWRQGVIGALLLAIAALWIGKAVVERQNGRLKAALAEANQMIEQERAEVRAKTALARALDAERAARVERDQAQISKEVQSDYQAKLDDLRRRHDALRMRQSGQAAADRGGGGTAPMPGLSGAAGGADGAADEDRLPGEDALIASEQALRLQALQDWVKGQQAVER